METKVSYTLVGLFVLILGAVAIIIPLWLASGLHHQKYLTYITYINESVEGLAPNATVDYNGVDVGFVKDIQINPKDTQQVILTLNIKPNTPITTNTTAILQSQGLTGVATIGLKGGSLKGAAPLISQPGQPYPVIPSTPSVFARLDQALSSLTANMNKLSNQVSSVFSDTNKRALSITLKNMSTLTHNINQSTQNMSGLATQLQDLIGSLQSFSSTLNQNPSILIRGTTPAKPGPGE